MQYTSIVFYVPVYSFTYYCATSVHMVASHINITANLFTLFKIYPADYIAYLIFFFFFILALTSKLKALENLLIEIY